MKKKNSIVTLILALCLCLAMAVPAFAADDQVRMIDVENDLLEYLAEYQPDIVFGSQEFIEYAVNVMVEDGDSTLATLDNYSDIRFYLGQYLHEFDQAQASMDFSVMPLSDTAFELPDEYKLQTLTDVKADVNTRLQSEEEIYENQDVAVPYYSYNPSAAVRYARAYANGHNDEYNYYAADCTNFVSQCLYAGGLSMNMPSQIGEGVILDSTTYWFSKRYVYPVIYKWSVSTSWIRVVDLGSYLSRIGARVIVCFDLENLERNTKYGDVVQLRDSSGGDYYHSIIITGYEDGHYTYCGHTNSAEDKLVTNIGSNNAFRILRP